MPFSCMDGGDRSSRTMVRRASHVRNVILTVTLATTLGTAVSAAQKKQLQTSTASNPAPAAATAPNNSDSAAPKVILIADGDNRNLQTTARTVADLLSEQNIHLSKLDRCSLPLNAPLKDGMTVTVARIRTETVVERKAIPFPTKQTFSDKIPVGTHNVLQAGKEGEKAIKYLCYYRNDVLTEKQKVGESTTAPRPQIERVGTRGMTLASRGYFGGRRIVEMVATGYGPAGNGRWGARTSSGLRPGFGVVAVDPRFIPLGTRLYIEGYGYAVAGDTGGAIKGNRIDLGHDSEAAARAVGRKHVRVLILD